MVNVIGVRFENAGKLYFFNPGALWPMPGDFVIVETTRGVEFGEVVTEVREIDDEKLNTPLRQVVRIATAEDVRHDRDNKAAEKEAFAIGQKKIADHRLDMKLVSVEYTFDNRTLLFYFTANGRVDFRSLVKDLASVFKTRIELRQIGVRDEAKMIGGLGPCGRPICCGTFLGDFQPVSIKMAKEQSLSLNPIKISGVCGRLMCCLKYEQDTYEEIRKTMPKEGREVITPEGIGVVTEVKVIAESVKVRLKKGDSFEVKEFPVSEVQRLSPQNASRQNAVKPETIPEAEEMDAQEDAAPERPERAERADRPNRRDHKAPEKAPEKPEQPPVKKPETGNPWKKALEQAMMAAAAKSNAPTVQPTQQPTAEPEQETLESVPLIPLDEDDDTI